MRVARFKIGLIAEGNTAFSTTLALPKLVEGLGPIKSLNLSSARRLSNSLRAGFPVNDYPGLSAAGMILIRAPEQSVARIVSELDAAGLDLRGVPVVLCETWLSSAALSVLTRSGALPASTVNLPIDQKDWFAVDGQTRAVRQVRRLIESSGGRCTELDDNGKQLLFAADLLISALAIPLYSAAQQSLRAGGFSGNLLIGLLEQMMQRTVRDFVRAVGTKSKWGGPMLLCQPETCEVHLSRVRELNPVMADFIAEQLSLARGFLGETKG